MEATKNLLINYSIISHKEGLRLTSPHFFILNKGLNSGRPQLDKPVNCWVLYCESEEDLVVMFGVCMALFQLGACRFYLVGSVIPFLRISDMKFLIRRAIELSDLEGLKDFSLNLDKLRQLEQSLHDQICLINQAKKALGSRVIRDHNRLFI